MALLQLGIIISISCGSDPLPVCSSSRHSVEAGGVAAVGVQDRAIANRSGTRRYCFA